MKRQTSSMEYYQDHQTLAADEFELPALVEDEADYESLLLPADSSSDN